MTDIRLVKLLSSTLGHGAMYNHCAPYFFFPPVLGLQTADVVCPALPALEVARAVRAFSRITIRLDAPQTLSHSFSCPIPAGTHGP